MLYKYSSCTRSKFLAHLLRNIGQITPKKLKAKDVADDLFSATLQLDNSDFLLLSNLDFLLLLLLLFHLFTIIFSGNLNWRIQTIKHFGMIRPQPFFAFLLVYTLWCKLHILWRQTWHAAVNDLQWVANFCLFLLFCNSFLNLYLFNLLFLVTTVFGLLAISATFRFLSTFVVLLFFLAENRVVIWIWVRLLLWSLSWLYRRLLLINVDLFLLLFIFALWCCLGLLTCSFASSLEFFIWTLHFAI